jgi:hypothetical protein
MLTKSIGAVIFIVGFIFMLYTGLGFITKEKVFEVGEFQVTKNKENSFSGSPLIGLGAMVLGGIIFVSGSRRNIRMGSE